MDRRTFCRQTAALAATVALPHRPRVRRGAGPNILYIVADDMGYGDLSITGRRDYATPVLDQLARDGVLCTQAYSSAPVCSPTRVAFMTGRYPARHPLGLLEPLTTEPIGLDPDPPTLPALLKRAGYETALIGKWHLGLLAAYHPLRHGFDEFYGFLGAAADYASHRDYRTHAVSYFQDGDQPSTDKGYLTDLFSDRAAQYVSRRRSRPFFLSLQYNAPHWPWQGPGDPQYPDTVHASTGGSPETYAVMMRSLDQGVGRVLEALRRSGLERDTLVVFTSDNGGERFSHMGPFRNGKLTVWEGGVRVAMAARWPGEIPAGSQSAQVAATFDLTATAVALAGAKPDPRAPLDGIDLLPALKGAPPRPRDLFWRLAHRNDQKALRSGDWKYLVDEQHVEHLFDLAHDPGEARDLARDERPVLERLRTRYAAWEATVLPPPPLLPPEQR
jgi:arylsulfatase A-like enzyme